MFLIAVDKSGCLLVEQCEMGDSDSRWVLNCLPTLDDSCTQSEVCEWLSQIGVVGISDLEYFGIKQSTFVEPCKFVICNFLDADFSGVNYAAKSLDLLWNQKIDNSISIALNKIVERLKSKSVESFKHLEKQFAEDFDLRKVGARVHFARNATFVTSETLVTFLGAFAVANGEKTARVCMHNDQLQPIQEMLMIHALPISTGPLRQNKDSSVSYHMIRGAIEITLHHDDHQGDIRYQIEKCDQSPSFGSSLRVPAKIFRTIRTLTDSAVFIEVQSGPFTDSDTEWQKTNENYQLPENNIFILGATGLLGSSLFSKLNNRGYQVFSSARGNLTNKKNNIFLDLTELNLVSNQLKNFPAMGAVVLTTGISKLRFCEENQEISNRINVDSQVALTNFFLEHGCSKIVFISSNRVFDGKSSVVSKNASYTPTTEYGRQKARAETELLKLGKTISIIRLTKVLSETNSLLVDWISKLRSGVPIATFTDVMISPVTLEDTVQVIQEVLERKFDSIVQFSASDEISYFELGRFLAQYIGVDERLVLSLKASDLGEVSVPHASLNCDEYRSVVPTSSLDVVKKVLEKML